MSGENFKKKDLHNFLYIEDFDEIPKEEPKNTQLISDIPNIPVNVMPGEDVLQEYYSNGVEDGRRLEKEIFDKEKIEIENQIKKNSISLMKNIEEKIEEVKYNILCEASNTILKSVASIFPNFLKKNGANEGEKIIKLIMPNLANIGDIKLTCSKEFFERIREYFPEKTAQRLKVEIDEKLQDGDFNFAWHTGQVSHEAAKRVEEIISDLLEKK